MAGLALKVPSCCFSIVVSIIEWIEVAKENDEMCGRIYRYARMLKGILEQLQGRDIPVSSGIDSALQNLQISLERCKGYVASLDKRTLAQLKRYGLAKGDHFTLQGLRDELNDAVGMMNAAVGSCSIMLQLDQRRESLRLHQEALYPNAGVYSYSYEKNSPSSPYAEVVADNETREFYLVVGWSRSTASDLTSYEVQYDETNQRSVRVDRDQTGVKLGKPKVYPGVFYRIRVREIYTTRSGRWSTTIPILMYSGPPNLHPELRVQTISTITAKITVQRPTPEEENGSPITSLIVERYPKPDLQKTEEIEEYLVKPGPERFIEEEITLEENTTTSFQVRLKNAAGASELSNEVRLTPKDLVPGPPNNLAVDGRANNRIKIKWKEPSVNATAVKEYQIDMRTRYTDWKHQVCRSSDKQSAVVTGLESNTKYWFRVFAINGSGRKGVESEELQTETKYGPKARHAATVFASIGGFFGGPLATLVSAVAATIVVPFMPIMGSACYAVVAHEGAEEENKTVAAVGGAIGGAIAGAVVIPLAVIAYPMFALASPFAGVVGAGLLASDLLMPDEISDD